MHVRVRMSAYLPLTCMNAKIPDELLCWTKQQHVIFFLFYLANEYACLLHSTCLQVQQAVPKAKSAKALARLAKSATKAALAGKAAGRGRKVKGSAAAAVLSSEALAAGEEGEEEDSPSSSSEESDDGEEDLYNRDLDDWEDASSSGSTHGLSKVKLQVKQAAEQAKGKRSRSTSTAAAATSPSRDASSVGSGAKGGSGGGSGNDAAGNRGSAGNGSAGSVGIVRVVRSRASMLTPQPLLPGGRAAPGAQQLLMGQKVSAVRPPRNKRKKSSKSGAGD